MVGINGMVEDGKCLIGGGDVRVYLEFKWPERAVMSKSKIPIANWGAGQDVLWIAVYNTGISSSPISSKWVATHIHIS